VARVELVQRRGELRPPDFLMLAGHPLRWRLLSELACSDRRVRELTGLLGERQSLISYHLGQLRRSRLVTMRRSSADGRDAYYSIDLSRCGDLLSAAGAALHPGLRLTAPPPAGPAGRLVRARVLFLCTGNGTRSQLAEALARHLSDGAVDAYSAGSHPKHVHPNAIRVMRERGIDLSGARAKHLGTFSGQHFDYVITLCDKVREICPGFPGHPQLIHWSIADPARGNGTDEETFPAFEPAAADIETRVRFLLSLITQPREAG
jgi:ArsR family transcriptional regulator, arsenate/arsenite/antimonite-responsive transcriptional repressor / arsenate reductase (thioredoxin)